MTCLGLRIRPGAVAVAAAIACSATTLRAQSADANPADTGVAVADGRAAAPPSNDVPIIPFAVVHPTYVPSQPALDDQIATDGESRRQPARRAPARAKKR